MRSLVLGQRQDLLPRCRKHEIVKLAFFGSVLTGEFTDESDVDVLVEFHPDHVPGLFGLVDMEFEFSDILRRKADLRTGGDLSRYFRDQALRSAVVQYAS